MVDLIQIDQKIRKIYIINPRQMKQDNVEVKRVKNYKVKTMGEKSSNNLLLLGKILVQNLDIDLQTYWSNL